MFPVCSPGTRGWFLITMSPSDVYSPLSSPRGNSTVFSSFSSWRTYRRRVWPPPRPWDMKTARCGPELHAAYKSMVARGCSMNIEDAHILKILARSTSCYVEVVLETRHSQHVDEKQSARDGILNVENQVDIPTFYQYLPPLHPG